MFLGEYSHTIDSKGRLTIPAKFRSELGAGLVVTRGFDQNLMLFTLAEWERLSDRIVKRPIGELDVRTLRRRVFSGAVDLSPDSHGRIVLPNFLREFARIDSEVVVAGLFDYIEVWSAEAWKEVRNAIEKNGDADRWADLGI